MFSSQINSITPNFSIHVTTGNESGFVLHTHIYGDFHYSKIQDSIINARDQLRKTAARQPNPNLPRVVALAFEGINGGGLEMDWQIAQREIVNALFESPDLSALSILQYSYIYQPKSVVTESWKGVIDEIVNMSLSPVFTHFTVIHNRWQGKDIEKLPFEVFADDKFIQFTPIEYLVKQ
jgi:hypothetical protein